VTFGPGDRPQALSIFGNIMGAIFGHHGTAPGASCRTFVERQLGPLRLANCPASARHRRASIPRSGRGCRSRAAGTAGALDGSAQMNVWLHKQVMTKLAEVAAK
jgi:Domain of unknown function (DUF3597)